MKAIMLRHDALEIRCESHFEEEWLRPLIGALARGEFKLFTTSAAGTGLLTIDISIKKKEEWEK